MNQTLQVNLTILLIFVLS